MQTSTFHITLPWPNPLMPHYWNPLQCVCPALFLPESARALEA